MLILFAGANPAFSFKEVLKGEEAYLPIVSTSHKNRNEYFAGVAQLAEQLTCNQQVVGSIPIASSIDNPAQDYCLVECKPETFTLEICIDLNIWFFSVVVNTSGCLPEDHQFESDKNRH